MVAGLHRLTGRGLTLLPAKTATGRRAVDLPPQAIRLLHDIKARQILLATEYGLPWTGEGYVFCFTDGRPFDPEMVTMDVYGHLMPGAGEDAAARFAEYLEKR